MTRKLKVVLIMRTKKSIAHSLKKNKHSPLILLLTQLILNSLTHCPYTEYTTDLTCVCADVISDDPAV